MENYAFKTQLNKYFQHMLGLFLLLLFSNTVITIGMIALRSDRTTLAMLDSLSLREIATFLAGEHLLRPILSITFLITVGVLCFTACSSLLAYTACGNLETLTRRKQSRLGMVWIAMLDSLLLSIETEEQFKLYRNHCYLRIAFLLLTVFLFGILL